jgi:hypothetical protein
MVLVILGRGKNTTEPQVPELSDFEAEMAIENIKDTNHQVLIKYQQN